MKTEAQKRNAHFGLAAAAMLLVGCLSILFVSDRTNVNKKDAQTGSNNVGSSNPSVSVVSPKL